MRTRLFQVEVTWLCTLVTDMWFETMSGLCVYRDLRVFRKQLMALGRTQSRQLTSSNIAISLRGVVHPLVS